MTTLPETDSAYTADSIADSITNQLHDQFVAAYQDGFQEAWALDAFTEWLAEERDVVAMQLAGERGEEAEKLRGMQAAYAQTADYLDAQGADGDIGAPGGPAWRGSRLAILEGSVREFARVAGRREATSLDRFTAWVHRERMAALDAYYASDRADMVAKGGAIALLYVNHKLHNLGVDVETQSTYPEDRR
jgi:hypothetical protein